MSKFRNTVIALLAFASVAMAGSFGFGTNRNIAAMSYKITNVNYYASSIYYGTNLAWSSQTFYSPASDFTYTTNNNEITITGYVGAGGQVNIPPTIDGWPVRVLTAGSFSYNDDIINVVVPDSVAEIGSGVGDGTFRACHNLETVLLGNGVTNILAPSFYNTVKLGTVVFPASLEHIGSYAFYVCTNLASVYFKGNAPTLGDLPFGANAAGCTVYRLSTATGFGTVPDTFSGLPTAIWTSYPDPMP